MPVCELSACAVSSVLLLVLESTFLAKTNVAKFSLPDFIWWALLSYVALVIFVACTLLIINGYKIAAKAGILHNRKVRLYMQTLEHLPDVIVIADGNFLVLYANEALAQVVGKPVAATLGCPALDLLFPDEQQRQAARHEVSTLGECRADVSYPVRREGMGSREDRAGMGGREDRAGTGGRDERVVEVALTRLDSQFPGEAAFIARVQDVTSRRQAETALQQQVMDSRASMAELVKERELLLKDTHRRVRDNMQLMIRLLQLQSEKSAFESVAAELARSQHRITPMALLHEILHQSDDPVQIDFHHFTDALVSDLFQQHARPAMRVSADIEAGGIRLHLEKAVPCGLILHELVTNSLVHGFSGKRGLARIMIHLNERDGHYLLRVLDDGKGLPGGFKMASDSRTGMALVAMMAAQLDGEIRLVGADGAGYEVEFPA